MNFDNLKTYYVGYKIVLDKTTDWVYQRCKSKTDRNKDWYFL